MIRYAHAPVLIAREPRGTRRVLVATDLSDPSLPALTFAASEAREGATVTALHCIEPISFATVPQYGLAWSPAVLPDTIDEGRELAARALGEALERYKLDAAPRVVVGPPATAIVSASEELAADLIVVGTRGKTGLDRVLLGSVAESVVRHAACSVIVVRLSPHEQEVQRG